MPIKISSLIVISAILVSGFMLFNVSQQVQEAQRQLAAINNKITYEQEKIKVLEAEWAYLNRPDRLEYLASHYLDMHTMQAQKVWHSLSQLPEEQIVTPVTYQER